MTKEEKKLQYLYKKAEKIGLFDELKKIQKDMHKRSK